MLLLDLFCEWVNLPPFMTSNDQKPPLNPVLPVLRIANADESAPQYVTPKGQVITARPRGRPKKIKPFEFLPPAPKPAHEDPPMTDQAPAPQRPKEDPPAAVATVPVQPAPLPPTPAAVEQEEPDNGLLEALAPRGQRKGIRVHRLREGGGRGELLFTVSEDEDPAYARERIERYGSGEYELAPVDEFGRYKGKGRILRIEGVATAATPAAAQAAPPAAPAFDVAGLIAGIQATMAQQQQAFAAAQQAMQMQMVQSQNELMKSLLPSLAGGGSGGGAGMGRLLETLLAHTLNAKASEADPIDRMMRFIEVGKKIREEIEPAPTGGDTAAIYAPLAQGFASLMETLRQNGAAKPVQRPMVKVAGGKVIGVRAPAPAALPAPAPAPAPAAVPTTALPAEVLAQIKPYTPQLVMMAKANAEPAHVLGLLMSALPEAEQVKVMNLLITPGILPALLQDVPELSAHQAWLQSVLDEAAVWVADASAPDAAEASAEATAEPIEP